MPILTDPEGPITLAEDFLAETIAASARFQTLVGAANAAQAKTKVFFDALPPPAAGGVHSIEEWIHYRPFALIYTDENTGYQARKTSAIAGYEDAGVMRFAIEQNVSGELMREPSENDRQFKNTLGVIVREMLALADEAGYLAITELVMQGPMRCPEDQLVTYGDHVLALFEVRWGTFG